MIYSKIECIAEPTVVDSIHFLVIAYVDDVYFLVILGYGGQTMADGFIWYELVTNDMDKAVAFYSKVVGWDIRDSGMPQGNRMNVGLAE